MKKITIILVFSLFFISCLIDEDFIREGFQTNYFNDTNQTYTGKIIIGGFKNNLFVATDSINFERAIESNRQTIMFTDANRWKPDLDKIRNLPSARCYFKIQLSDGRNQLITRYNSSELTSLQIPNTTHFRGDFGYLLVYIKNDQIAGRAAEEEEEI